MINFSMTLTELANICDGTVLGDADTTIVGVCSAELPVDDHLTFIASSALAKKVNFSDEVAYLVKPDLKACIVNGICHDNPQQAFRQILVELSKKDGSPSIADNAIIAATAHIGKDVSIGANAVIGQNVFIGEGCQIGCGVVIEDNATIAQGSRIGHRAIIHHETQIGKDCVISEGAVIGGQGFGFSLEGGVWRPVPQVGRVIIGDYVHIGANTCIDRGAINDTKIGNNVIIDNLIHIAHNVEVGEGTAMAAGVGIAGSTKVGKYCLLAGQVGVVGHIEIADQVQVNGGSRVLQSIKESGVYAGSFNVQPVQKWNRISVYLKKIEKLFKREKNNDK